MIKKIVFLSFISFSIITSCSSDDDSITAPSVEGCTDEDALNYNENATVDDGTCQYSVPADPTTAQLKAEMLTNWADNFIIPNYHNFSDKLTELESSVITFNNFPSIETLEIVRISWLEAYKSWQHIEMFNIGPAEQTFYHLKMNIYPTSTENIQSFLNLGDFSNLDNAPYYSAQGLPAMDYLLFGIAENDTSLVNLYNSNSKYSNYLTEITNRMVSNTNYIINEWVDYRAEFIASVENTATSSVNKMCNDFIYYYEKGFRANKFGIPVGVFSAGNIFPDKVEAYYSENVSRTLALEAIDAIDSFFKGNDESSLMDFISYSATEGMISLSDEIIEQFSLARLSIEGLDSNFANQLNNEFLAMATTYDIIQAGTVLLKTDMLSVLQIATDYVDADGD
tara:strand:- start:126 stop:1313 length:1188 start_codon:yes stop_codon:yes gene_type:complete